LDYPQAKPNLQIFIIKIQSTLAAAHAVHPSLCNTASPLPLPPCSSSPAIIAVTTLQSCCPAAALPPTNAAAAPCSHSATKLCCHFHHRRCPEIKEAQHGLEAKRRRKIERNEGHGLV
jgi:hypothetical protein